MSDLLVLDGGWSSTREAEQGYADWRAGSVGSAGSAGSAGDSVSGGDGRIDGIGAAAGDAGRRTLLACTHFVPGERAVVVSIGRPAPGPEVEGGRAFVFSGSDLLVGRLTVAEALEASALDRVVLLGGTAPGPDAVLDTQGFVRPVVSGGRLVLHVRPARDGLVPFEQPVQTPCCATHG